MALPLRLVQVIRYGRVCRVQVQDIMRRKFLPKEKPKINIYFWSLVASHTKKAVLVGTPNFQMMFHGSNSITSLPLLYKNIQQRACLPLHPTTKIDLPSPHSSLKDEVWRVSNPWTPIPNLWTSFQNKDSNPAPLCYGFRSFETRPFLLKQ